MSEPIQSEEQRAELGAATKLWERLAAFAWDQFITFGPGVVLMEKDDMLAASRALSADEAPPSFAPGYVPLSDVPPGDDFGAVLRTIDPKRQVALLVRRHADPEREDAEQLYILEMLERRRPSPEECYFKLRGRRSSG